VAVHLLRLQEDLKSRFGLDVTVWNESKEPYPTPRHDVRRVVNYPSFCLALLFRRERFWHLHTVSRLLLSLLPFYRLLGKRFMLTCHGEFLNGRLQKRDWASRRLREGLASCEAIVCVGEHIREQLEENGLPAGKLVVIHSFLPPDPGRKPRLPGEVQAFLDQAPGPVLASNGSLRLLDGRDMYGIDQMVEMLPRLRVEGPAPRLLIYLYDAPNSPHERPERLLQLLERARELGVGDRILFHKSRNEEFWPVLEHSRVFLRATLSEGFGISVLEAFAAGVPVVANAAAPRQAGCMLYPDRDIDRFARCVESALEMGEEERAGLRRHPMLQVDTAAALVAQYRALGFISA